MEKCVRATCFVPDTGCDLGHTDLKKCPVWRGAEQGDKPSDDISSDVLLPWSGSALGLVDLSFVSGHARPIIIGVVGPQNAGKTTLLAAWYLLLGRGLIDLGGRLFAGSYTLSGWEAVAGAMRWSRAQPPRFPAHTTSRGGRAPGMLHLAFREPHDGRRVDFLFTDAPGEWFQKWALNADSQEGAGARWVSDNADAFLVVADREALSGGNMGSARSSLQLIAKRLSSELRDRPVSLVWTKADVEIEPDMERAVRKAVMGAMSDAVEHSVSVVARPDADRRLNKGTGFVELLRWAVDIQRAEVKLPPSEASSDDLLFIYGTRK
jgi:hypothetical protein